MTNFVSRDRWGYEKPICENCSNSENQIELTRKYVVLNCKKLECIRESLMGLLKIWGVRVSIF